MKKLWYIGSLLMVIFLLSGCAVSDYLTGVEQEKPYSLLTEEEAEGEDDLEEIIDELEELEEEDVEEEETEEVSEDEAPIVITIKEDETVNLKPKAKDADEDTIVYSFSEPLDSYGKWITTYGDAGEYLITVSASDGKLETSRSVLLVVEKVNVAPVITGVLSEIEVSEGDILVLEPKTSDPNGDDVELTISEPVGDDGEWIIGYKDAGTYTVEVTATDGEKSTVVTIALTVKKKNVAPTIEAIDDIELDEGDTVFIEPVVDDLNEDEIIVTISEPVGDDGLWGTEYTDNGVYTVVVTADDGTATTTQEITITVNDVNVAPVIEDIVQV